MTKLYTVTLTPGDLDFIHDMIDFLEDLVDFDPYDETDDDDSE